MKYFLKRVVIGAAILSITMILLLLMAWKPWIGGIYVAILLFYVIGDTFLDPDIRNL